MLQKKISILLASLFCMAAVLGAQTTIESTMDWATGMFRIQASRVLKPGMSPDDHPRAIEALEGDIVAMAVIEFGNLAWDNRGSLENLLARNPSARTLVESLALSLKREWSRLSDDYKFVEAAYSINLAKEIPLLFQPAGGLNYPEIPLGWRAVPEDDWTGIIIFAPRDLPVRGTALSADPQPALRARILDDNLDVVIDSAAGTAEVFSYISLDNRQEAEAVVGRRPFRTMARGLYGDVPCDMILSNEDVADIMASESGRRSISEGRIVILLENPAE